MDFRSRDTNKQKRYIQVCEQKRIKWTRNEECHINVRIVELEGRGTTLSEEKEIFSLTNEVNCNIKLINTQHVWYLTTKRLLGFVKGGRHNNNKTAIIIIP